MNAMLFCFTVLVVFGTGFTRAMVPTNPYEGLDVIALLQWYQNQYPNAPVPAHLLLPKQPQTAGQPQTSPPQAPPTAPAPAPAPQPQTPSASSPTSQPQPQPQPQPQTPTAVVPGRGMPNMPNVDPVTQMLLMAARMKRKYRRGEFLAPMPPFFPGGWVIAADGTDANVLGRNGRKYTIDSNRMCIAGKCLRVL